MLLLLLQLRLLGRAEAAPPELAKYAVVVGEHATGPTVFAAHQLAHFAGLAADRGRAALPVVSVAQLVPGQPAFVVGAEAAVASGLTTPTLRSPGVIRDDGYFCSSTPDLMRVVLAGGVPPCWPACNQTEAQQRGTINAVFEYLRALGFGFYAVNATALPATVPVRSAVACNRVHSPSFNFRFGNFAFLPFGQPNYWPGSGGAEAMRPLHDRSLWAVANHFNGAMDNNGLPALPTTWGGVAGGAGGYNIAGFVHTSERLVPAAKYPQWYAGSKQLCE